MKKLIMSILVAATLFQCSPAMARGGFSSGGSRGGFSSSRSFSSPSRSFSSPSRSYSSSRSTTVINRNYGGGYGGMGYHPMMYPGFGMGYGYSNGMLTGLIIGNMMHPQGTTVYQGGGYAGGQALMYPDGRVVDQNGVQVGTYLNGQFTAVQNGSVIAQPVPAGFVPPQQDDSAETLLTVLGVVAAVVLVIAIFIALA